MWLSPRSLLMGIGPKILVGLVVAGLVVVIVAGVVSRVRGCDSGTASNPDFLEDARDGVLDRASERREENDRRIEELEIELYDLRLRVEELDAEITESAIQREEIHDAIDQAVSIDDIDRILRGGIPGVSGRR